MTARIFLKLIAGVICLLVIALVTADVLVSRVAESSYVENLRRELAERGRVLALALGEPRVLPQPQVDAFARAANARFTMIAGDGKVLADSEANPERMENHRSRPEFAQALRGDTGSSVRHSATIGVNFLYVAVPVREGALRLAVPLSQIELQVNEVRRKILASTALAFLPAFLLAAFLARYLSGRLAGIIDFASELAKGNFRARLAQVDHSELGQLARKLNETGEKLQAAVEQLQTEHAELEKLERIRKDFVINVSHELRTPLASIQGYAETLMDGAIEDRQNNLRFLGIIRQNAERLARLTEDLLTLSRIEMKRRDFRPDLYPVNELLGDAVDTLMPVARKKQVQLTIEPAPDTAEAFCDSAAVSQILGNLLDNAIKYTPNGGRITVGAREAEGKRVELFVRDSGSGIPEDELPRLFERFYRVDKARSRALGGTGLGLAIVKHLVLAHGGKVWVESAPNQGSTFRFTLPAEDPGLGDPELNAEFTAS